MYVRAGSYTPCILETTRILFYYHCEFRTHRRLSKRTKTDPVLLRSCFPCVLYLQYAKQMCTAPISGYSFTRRTSDCRSASKDDGRCCGMIHWACFIASQCYETVHLVPRSTKISCASFAHIFAGCSNWLFACYRKSEVILQNLLGARNLQIKLLGLAQKIND